METSDQTPPPHSTPTLEWAKEALDGRVAVLAGLPATAVGYSKESRYGSPEQVSEIRVSYPGVTVKTVRYPSESRPAISIAELVNELTSFEDVPDDFTGEELEVWMERQMRQPAPPLETTTEPLVIANKEYSCRRSSLQNGASARVAELDGVLVIVSGKDIDRLELTWV